MPTTCGCWPSSAKNPTYEAVALTLRTLLISNVIDIFGDAPYTEAFKGPRRGISQPKFDRQEMMSTAP